MHCIKIRICKQYTLNLQKYVNCKSPWRIKQKRENVAGHTKKKHSSTADFVCARVADYEFKCFIQRGAYSAPS